MADALVTIAAEEVLKKVLSLVAAEVVLAWGYEKKLAALHETLDLIRAKLRDAERQKETEAVMVWLKQLKHVVSEADEVLDEIDYEVLRHEVKKRDRMTRKVPSLPSLKKFSFRSEMGHKIENINRKLAKIDETAIKLGLQNEQPVGLVPDSLDRETDSYLGKEFKIFGREDDELRIIQLLTQTRKEEELTIVPIVGMGGIGKTTLAMSVYHNPKIEQHFDVKAWLCVSVKVDVNTLLAKIYESLAGEEPKSKMRDNLIRDLRSKLGSKRYLLVLDDVWDEEKAHWDIFRSCMLKVDSKSGSGILVTTRNHNIGERAMTEDFHSLRVLSDDQCWPIFKERAFVAGQSPSPELEEIGRDIVEKCHGLPLLVNVIGSMLRNSDREKWLFIRNSKVWDMTEGRDRVLKSLKLSYDNLPNSIVKQCFAYCSMFEKDKVMEREELIQLWMALGLVQSDERTNKEAEDVGNDIFRILVSCSLFQDVKVHENGYVTCCMHDLVHDLSISVSNDDSLCLVGPTNDDIPSITQVKHLSILHPYREDKTRLTFGKMFSEVFKEDMTASLHTLIFQGEVEKNMSFQRFKFLRILKFTECRLEKIDDSIGELVHLRYLDLSDGSIEVLPESISKLYHLQTLKLYKILKKWPKDMHNLISLRHLMVRQVGEEGISIRNVGQLTSLRTLRSFRVGREKGYQVAELGRLKHLSGHLFIKNLESINNKEDAAKADLSGKKNLNRIDFSWSSIYGANRNNKDVLEGLQPPVNVTRLTITKFSGDDYPTWVMKMSILIEGNWMPLDKLVQISLHDCSCLYLPVLENLPVLQYLDLSFMDNLTCLSNPLVQGDNVTGSMKPLSPSLRSLRLYCMKRLEKWIDTATTNSSTMLSPVLESLFIEFCPNITHLDECHPHPLVSLKIKHCENLVSIKSIQGLTSLESLEIEGCPSLLEIGFLQNYEHHPLKRLRIFYNEKLTSVPRFDCFSFLNELSIELCCNLTSLPRFDCFSFLNKLQLGPFAEELHSFPSLQGIERLRNHLRYIKLVGWPHWESIPEEIKYLTSLTKLEIKGFGIRELPVWLTNMSSIRHISFDYCKRLDKETVKRGAHREQIVSI